MPKKIATVTVTHPKVGEAQVPEMAVPHWRRAGWSTSDDSKQAAGESAGVAVQDDKAPRGRRKSEGEG